MLQHRRIWCNETGYSGYDLAICLRHGGQAIVSVKNVLSRMSVSLPESVRVWIERRDT